MTNRRPEGRSTEGKITNMITKAAWGAGLLLCAATASAKDKIIPLSEADAAALRGKTVALTVHGRPSFSAFTAGKATFGLLGAAAMISAGNKIVDENGVQDPAILVRERLAQILHDTYGAIVLDPDTTANKAKKPKDLAALHPEADYVFDVQSGLWMFSYYPSDWDNYWVGYSVQSQLVDTHSNRQLTNMACTAGTKDSPVRPSRDQLLENEAQLLKDVTQHLGWTCTHLLAKEQFHLADGEVVAIPEQYRDPMSRLADPAGDAQTDAGTPLQVSETAVPEESAPEDPSRQDAAGASADAAVPGPVH
jgi:hypothetical protein